MRLLPSAAGANKARLLLKHQVTLSLPLGSDRLAYEALQQKTRSDAQSSGAMAPGIVLFCAGQAPSTGGTAARVNTSLPGCCAVSRVIGLRPQIIQCYT
jgi:hypothetical protein